MRPGARPYACCGRLQQVSGLRMPKEGLEKIRMQERIGWHVPKSSPIYTLPQYALV